MYSQYGESISDQAVMDLQVSNAQLCDKLGYDSVWVNEHHVTGDLYFPPLILLSVLAMKTRRVKLGAFIITPFYHPLELAEQLATVDLLSKGRVVFGPVAGYRREEFEAYGVPLKKRALRMEETIELVKMFWTQDYVNYRGRCFTLSNVVSLPKPLQTPHPPIWVGAMYERGVKIAAKLGDGWVAHLALTPLPIVVNQIKIYRETLKSIGKDISKQTIASIAYLSIDNDSTIACDRAQTYMASSISTYLKWGLKGESLKFLSDSRFIIGDPDECIRRIEEIRRIGITYLILRVGYKGMKPLEVENTIYLFGKKVLPYFKDDGEGFTL